ncbi:hypothetical protein, conserved [Babesia ovata]|uniref:Extracellular matrix-binding ebh n=1 Tax=Babesia ovata TaxID=189622 RepID=A0A2H6KKK8_9APIC|nr:uncharacterized protein BOVATA_050010 [Babesia ovata]GBE63508.1 hypothetical protein, conserved [Babesia ovata]
MGRQGDNDAFAMGFEGIKKAVKEYAEGFRDANFENTVKGWIQKILETETIVKEKIDGYLKDNTKEQPGRNFTLSITIKDKIKADVLNPTSYGNEKSQYKLQEAIKLLLHQLVGAARGAAKELHSLALETRPPGSSPGSIAEKIKEAHTNVKSLNGQLDTATGKISGRASGTNPNHAQAVDKAIEAVGATLEQQLPNGSDNTHVKLKDATSFSRYNTHVSQDEEALKALASGNLENIKGALPEAIKGIRTQVETDFQAVNAATKNKKEFATLSEAITSNLKSLTDTVSQVGQKINAKLTELKSKIGKKEHGKSATDNTLQKIHENLEKLLNNELNTAIQNTDNLLKSEVSKYQQQCIQSLESHVDSEVKEAIEKLTTQANKNYVTSIKEMLNAFADRVQKELKPLPKDIDTDLITGFKGFMRTVQGVISDNDTSSVHINLLSSLASESTDTAEQKAQLFKTLSTKFKEFVGPLKRYLDTEIKRLYKDINAKKNPPVIIKDTDKHPYADALDAVQSKLNTLLDELHNSNHFTHSLTFNLGNLSSALHSLVPTNFEGPCNTLLDVLKTGLTGMHAELKKAYVSVYDDAKIDWADEKNPEKEKCAKILVTIMETVRYQLNRLQNGCKSDKNKTHKLTYRTA